MAITMYQACVPVVTQMLNGLAGVIEKASLQIAAKQWDEAALLQARLFPDMFPLTRQVRQATEFGRNAPARLAGVDLPAFPENDGSFAELKTRIAKSLDFIKTFVPAQIDGTEDKSINWTAGTRQMSFKGQAYLLEFCLPNLFFHCTTAYGILRTNGIEVGKRDYMGHL